MERGGSACKPGGNTSLAKELSTSPEEGQKVLAPRRRSAGTASGLCGVLVGQRERAGGKKTPSSHQGAVLYCSLRPWEGALEESGRDGGLKKKKKEKKAI